MHPLPLPQNTNGISQLKLSGRKLLTSYQTDPPINNCGISQKKMMIKCLQPDSPPNSPVSYPVTKHNIFTHPGETPGGSSSPLSLRHTSIFHNMKGAPDIYFYFSNYHLLKFLSLRIVCLTLLAFNFRHRLRDQKSIHIAFNFAQCKSQYKFIVRKGSETCYL